MINYWAIPNMGKEHLMFLSEINRKSYTKSLTRYYFWKHWHDPDNYKKRIEKTYLVRSNQSKVETPIRGRTTYGERPDLSGIPSTCYVHYFGGDNDSKPPYDFLKGKDIVEVLFTDKWFKVLSKEEPTIRGAGGYFTPSLCVRYKGDEVRFESNRILEIFQQVELLKELQKDFPSSNHLDTFLEPYILTHPEYIREHVDDLCDVDVLFNPFALMGKKESGRYWSDTSSPEKTELEEYVIKTYKSRKNVIPYKENLVECFQSKLKMMRTSGSKKKCDVLEEYKKDKRKVWFRLDEIVRNVRRIEKYLQDNNIDPVYFNLDRGDYKETFGFEKDDLPRTKTDFGDYPERKQFEQIAKEYITERDMRDMRRRNRLRDGV
tara:strand:+ start:25 stop:1152 length:1128 start_codon:yes stop_codon:yes gene_type:complete